VRIDAHQHFWRYSATEYGWIDAGMAVLKQDRLPENLAPLLEASDIDGTVAVQARQTLDETQWLLDLAGQHGFIKGVVELCSSDLRAQLARFGEDPKFCGVRHVVQDEPDGEFMLRDDFLGGVAILAEFGLTYDILIYPRHLPVACELVARFPEQPFVLDHIAKPAIRDGLLEPWASDIRRLAGYPNIWCKVSGLATEADWRGWEANDFYPYLDIVFEAFGPGRIMFGSDWPVCTLAARYEEVDDLLAGYTSALSTDEQAGVWGGTARRFYGLD
jgi:L-fuconolactonase